MALAVDSVKDALDDERMRAIVHGVVVAVQQSTTLDWRKSRARQADLRKARRALIKHGFEDAATRDDLVELIFEQALRIAA